MSEVSENRTVSGAETWNFAGWGHSSRIADIDSTSAIAIPARARLGAWRATAICGNDITSSVLYVSALCAAQAGALAPIVLIFVSALLYLYRSVYAEVGTALRMNGGTYTVLLNTTSKRVAAMAACLTLLSYIATAVISASEAMHYAQNLIPRLEVVPATIALMAFFAAAVVVGIEESSSIALGIFAIHIVTLTALCISASAVVVADPAQFQLNWSLPSGEELWRSLFFGFAAAMLGISGFESSANFIEEQKEGVFPITLRNMWIAVAVFNPLVSLLSLGLIPLAQLREAPTDLLADMGRGALGDWFALWVSADAVLVLSGAVLTSFIGVTGLVRRMTLDGCLPQLLLRRNRWRDTNHWIIAVFFALCSSILLVTSGDIGTLAGVYTLSFLSVMMLFALGNMLLKRARARLPRRIRASWPVVILALLGACVGLLGNVLLDPAQVRIFVLYFAIAAGVVALMFERLSLLKLALYVSRGLANSIMKVNEHFRERVLERIRRINSLAVVYFSNKDDPAVLNRAALYVLRNEPTNHMIVVSVYSEERGIPVGLAQQLAMIDRLYPELRIDFLAVRGEFGPALIDRLSQRIGVAKNYMFIGTPGPNFPHALAELGGVRVIL